MENKKLKMFILNFVFLDVAWYIFFSHPLSHTHQMIYNIIFCYLLILVFVWMFVYNNLTNWAKFTTALIVSYILVRVCLLLHLHLLFSQNHTKECWGKRSINTCIEFFFRVCFYFCWETDWQVDSGWGGVVGCKFVPLFSLPIHFTGTISPISPLWIQMNR